MPTKPRIAGMFYIGDPAEGRFGVMEWHPDPAVLEAEILQMADDFDNWDVAMEEATDILIEDTKMHFKYEEGPDEVKWEPLSGSEDMTGYYRRKMNSGAPDQILVRTSDMYDAATSRAAWFHTERSIMFNADALPKAGDGVNYGMAHQGGTGAKTEMKRKAFSILEDIEAKGGKLEQKHVDFLQGFSQRGLDLPARPFIGASEIAIEQVEQVFLRHLHNTVEIPWEEEGLADIGGITEMGSNVRGTFPVIGHLPSGQPRLSTGQFGRMR